MFTNINDAVKWIESIKRFGDKYDLSRMELACKLLGNPEQNLKVIHIAGTNGKGSTVSYLKHILLENEYNVGTFTSPYIVRFNERITYNYNDISDEEFIYYVNLVFNLYNKVLNDYNDVITFFELITLISFMYFNDKDIDFVIYEVGLGGLLDATNVVNPLIAGITSINYDHMNVLGDTLEEILLNKLGIVKENVPLVTSVRQTELHPVIKKYCNAKKSDLLIISAGSYKDIEYGSYTKFKYKNEDYKLSLLGNHQVWNAALAIEIIFKLNKLNYTDVSINNIKIGLLNTFWPGRFERFGNIVLDGAHNIGGMTALKESIETLYKGHYIKSLYTSMADKEYFDIIKLLESFVDEIHFTEFEYERCESADNLYEVSTINKKFKHKDVFKAINELKNLKNNELLLITGSLYFISLVRKELKKRS